MVSELILEAIYSDMNKNCNNYKEKMDYLEFLINELEETITDINLNPWDYD